LVTILVVSVLAFVVSVAAFVVSTFTVVSLVVFMELDESVLAVSDELPELLPLHAAIDIEMANASNGSLKEFFIMCVV
jgi:hypothetical protein